MRFNTFLIQIFVKKDLNLLINKFRYLWKWDLNAYV